MKKNTHNPSFIITESEERFDKERPETPKPIEPMIYKDFNEIELNEEELENIEQRIKDAESDIHKSLQDISSNSGGIYFSIASSILFIVLCILLSGISIISGLNSQAENLFENSEWEPDSFLSDVQTVEDLDAYMRLVYFSVITSKDNEDFNSMFIGSRLTLNLYKQIENEISEYNEVILCTFEDQLGGLYGKKFTDSDMGLWTYHDNSGFMNNGGYVSHFLDSSKNSSLNQWRELKPIWLAPNFATLVIETLFHNRNLKATLLFTIEFEKGPSGFLTVKTSSAGSFYEEYELKTASFITIMAILCIYLISLIVKIIEISQSLIKTCRIFWSTFKIDLGFFEIIDILNVVMTLTTVCMTFVIIVSNIGKYSLPLGNDGVDGMIDIVRSVVTITRINSVTCVLIMIKMTLVLKSKFPSFGVLFDTIWKSKNDLINFSFITLILLFGFVYMGVIAFGTRHSMFKSIQGALNALFITILSSVGYSDLEYANSTLAPIFCIVYCTLFYTILLNMFIAIVISTYIEIKSYSQLMLEAKAAILTKEGIRFIKNVYNLLFFRVKNDLVEECKMFLILSSTSKEERNEEIVEKLKQLEASIYQQINVNYYAVFKFNLGQFTDNNKSGHLKTNEQVKEEIKSVLRNIFLNKRKKQLFKQMKQNDVHYNYNLIIGMFLFIIFTALLLTITLSRMRISEKNNLRNIMTEIIDLDELNNIVSENDIYDYLENRFYPALSQNPQYNFNYYFTDPVARITVNKLVVNENKSDFSKKSILQYINTDLKFIKENMRGTGTDILYIYRDPGDISTYDKIGGFVSYIYSDTDKDQYFYMGKKDRIASKTTDTLAIEWLMYNSNVEIFSFCAIVFKNMPSGLIEKDLVFLPVDMEIFTRQYLYIGILEVIFGLFVLYFIYFDIKAWLVYWKKYQAVRLEKKAGDKIVHKVKKLLSDQDDDKGCKKILKTSFKGILRLVIWCTEYLVQILRASFDFLTSGTFVILNITGNTLSILLLIQVIKLYTNDFVHDYKIGDDYPEIIGEMHEVSMIYRDYRIYASFLVFFTFIRILQFYHFNNDLSILTDVLNSAKFDIFFFIAMFLIIHLGYSMMGYLILGTSIYDFSTIMKSLLSCYLILLGSFDLDAFQVADPYLGMMFFGTFIVVFYLLLLNMFTAIIGAHHSIFEEEDLQVPNVGFFEKIYNTIRDAKCPKKKKPGVNLSFINKLSQPMKLVNEDENIDIRLELIDYPVSAKFFEGCDAWYNLLEQTLRKFSKKKIILSEFRLNKDNNSELLKSKAISEIALISTEQWISEPIKEKIGIWRTLSSVQYKNNILVKANTIITEGVLQPLMNISPIMEKLWKITDPKDKILMWAGKIHLRDFERISIWNSLAFSQNCYPHEKVSMFSDGEWNVDVENEVWLSLTFAEKLAVAQKIIEPLKKLKKLVEKSRYINETFLVDDRLKNLNFKDLLWLCLGFNAQWKFSIYINNDELAQAEIIAFLLFCEYEESVFQLEYADVSLWEQLNCCIHEKLYAECEYNAEKVKVKLIREKHQETQIDIESLKNYYIGLKNDVEQYKKTRNYLYKQNEIFRKRNEMNKKNKK